MFPKKPEKPKRIETKIYTKSHRKLSDFIMSIPPSVKLNDVFCDGGYYWYYIVRESDKDFNERCEKYREDLAAYEIEYEKYKKEHEEEFRLARLSRKQRKDEAKQKEKELKEIKLKLAKAQEDLVKLKRGY